MYGKIFEQMFTGSMVGTGAIRFAVMSYIVSHMKPGEEGQLWVELNAKVLGPILGEGVDDVQGAIEAFCKPDPESRSREQEGRRLLRSGQFLFQVVNGAKYRAMRNAEDRREYQRVKQKEYRLRRKGTPASGREQRFVKAVTNGDEAGADRIVAEGLPVTHPPTQKVAVDWDPEVDGPLPH